MNNKVYLVILEGGGDMYIKVVDQETFDWICSDDMGCPEGFDPMEENSYSWNDQLVPASQIAKMQALHKEHFKKGWCFTEEFDGVSLSRGSWDNDRAIHAVPADGYDDYTTVKEALQAIKKHGDEMEDEYQGCMY